MALRLTIIPIYQRPVLRETLTKYTKGINRSFTDLYSRNVHQKKKKNASAGSLALCDNEGILDNSRTHIISCPINKQCCWLNSKKDTMKTNYTLPYNYDTKKTKKFLESHTLIVITPCRNLSIGNVRSNFKLVTFLKPRSIQLFEKKFVNLSCSGDAGELIGLVLGVFTRTDDPYGTTKIYTKFAEEIDNKLNKRISDILDTTGPIPLKGQCKVLYKIDPMYATTVIVGIGDECASYNEKEEIDEMKENVRDATALGVRVLQDLNMKTILVDSMENAEAAAEGAALGVWRFQELRSIKRQVLIPRLELLGDCDYTAWQIGLQKAAAQNLARQLCETPPNLLTPLGFSQATLEVLSKAGVNVEVKGRDWANIMKMGGFLAAAKGSCENPVFLEVSYYGCEPDVQPVVLIGKGVTFDSGGLCLKQPCPSLKYMRGDMAGAACVVAAIRAAAALRLPINIRGLMPIYENLPGACAMKPGDIVRVKNGKTVLINTDHDGRLSIADALCYSTEFNPKFILDVGTLSKELLDSLGPGASAVFSNNDSLFQTLKNSAVHTGDRVWRLPLWSHFSNKVTLSQSADVQDKAVESGLTCTCAAFLREFIPPVDWLHVDTYATAVSDGKTEQYLTRGMSGRPTRTIIEFLAQLDCKADDYEDTANPAKKQ